MAESAVGPLCSLANLGRCLHLLAIFCVVSMLVKLIKLYQERQKNLKIYEKFPGPPVHWLIGHMHVYTDDEKALINLTKCVIDHPAAIGFWSGPFNAQLLLYDAEYAKTIFTTTEPKDDLVYPFLLPWIGEGLLISSGQKWFRHRRLLTPGFHYDVLKPYVKLVADSTNVMLDKWEKLINKGQSLEIFQHVSLMTLDSIMKCAFSYHSNCQIESENVYIQAVYELCDLINQRFRCFPYYNDLIYYLSLKDVVSGRLARLHITTQDEDGKGLSDENIQAEVDTFMFEGHDTTASGISWILYCMALYPEHQQRCREEIQDVLTGRDTLEWADLGNLVYTTMCIKESLRLYPPVPGVGRMLTKPMRFFDGRSLPEGCIVAISIYCLHRNPQVWENPEVFDPLRFSPENSTNRHPYAFIPFAAGPRNCIGQHFAMNEMKVAVALTLNRLKLAPDLAKPPLKVPRLVLRSINGIHLKITKTA
nr:PREDICTED: LOW QUALITY PROTEIN: cytochrome P450 4B1-like [Latimeria chalumnae]|eukprot:XP_014342452.1 PREDICTED: LOW QUALITY PROTEIN: cytochrome P450 4B1-like [Latimeria chalumnae]